MELKSLEKHHNRTKDQQDKARVKPRKQKVDEKQIQTKRFVRNNFHKR